MKPIKIIVILKYLIHSFLRNLKGNEYFTKNSFFFKAHKLPITYNLFLCFHGYAHVVYSHVQDLTRDTYYETGDPPRLPAQLEGRWGQWH
jgi:hypothetical protein